MKNIQRILFIVMVSVLINSCSTDFLNLTPKDSISESAVWGDPNLVELFVNEMYRGLGHGHHEAELSSMVDESHFIHNYGTNQVVLSIITPSDIGQWNRGNQNAYRWSRVYGYIRNANMFMENIDDVPFEDEAWRERLKGEVYFLIAYYYHNLVRLHGGVPIVTKVYGLEDDYAVPRNSLKECVDYIVENADKAAAILPEVQEGANLGRANKGGALALKSRILLWAASDLVHENWYGSYEQPGLVTIGGDRTAAWTAAKKAAFDVMSLPVGYTLHDELGDPFQDYTDLFIHKSSSEHIFSRYFIKSSGWSDADNNMQSPLYNGPNGYAAWAGNTPIQALVDDYEMADGTRFDWNNPVHAAAPYENRDPRFYASILYDGAPWRQRPTSTAAFDPLNQISIRTVYKGNDTNSEVASYGVDTRQGPQQTWNGGYTGYYLRKTIDIAVDPEFTYSGAAPETPWVFFRLGEIYLNYAEACIELGEDAEAKTYLNMIRKRAGMPDITETGDALRERYRNERRIEMFNEQSRYFDVRRWLIGDQVYHNTKGIVINEFSDGRVEYSVHEVSQPRGWDDKTNLLPILQDEMNRNTTLIQNPLYQ